MYEQKEVLEELEKSEIKLRYLAEKEKESGISEILLDIALTLFSCRNSKVLTIDEGVKNGKEDFE